MSGSRSLRNWTPAPADSISCTKVVTRKEFDSLLNAANVSGQQVSPVARQNFAKGYVLYLAFEQAAKQADANRARFGRTKSERILDEERADRANKLLDQHRIDGEDAS